MKRIVGLMMVLIALSGCTKPNNSTPVSQSRGGNSDRARDLDGDNSVSGIRLKGAVLTDAYYQEDFNEGVRNLMEMVIDREEVGYVSAQATQKTGVYVGAKVRFEGNPNVRSGRAQANASLNSRLVVAVFDRFDEAVPALPALEFRLVDGYVDGNYADLVFQQMAGNGDVDNFIRISGTFDQSWFVGAFEYDVQSTWDGGGEGHAGALGDLHIKTCDIFRCN